MIICILNYPGRSFIVSIGNYDSKEAGMNLTPEQALERYANNSHIPLVVARARVQRWIDMCMAQGDPVIGPVPRKGEKPTVEEIVGYIVSLFDGMDDPGFH